MGVDVQGFSAEIVLRTMVATGWMPIRGIFAFIAIESQNIDTDLDGK